jgi:hypothetical protein
VQPLRRPAEVELLRYGDEVAQMAQLHAAIRSPSVSDTSRNGRRPPTSHTVSDGNATRDTARLVSDNAGARMPTDPVVAVSDTA